MSVTKLGRKELPAGFRPELFKYVGRPASDQGDFKSDVGIADMACVNQFGEANNAKYYHAGVVSALGQFFVYLEWGRIKGGKSWTGSFNGQDFQFVKCDSEAEARDFFQKQCTSKNIKRLEQKDIGGKLIWAAKAGDDGYIVQKLAARERGLPDAYTIKDGSGVAASAPVSSASPTVAARPQTATPVFQPQVVSLANALVGGTKTYARAATEATGIIPTMAAIDEVRNDCLPQALKLISVIGNDVALQVRDSKLIDLSKYVAAIVPRPIPRGGSADDRARATILSADNIMSIQSDLDAFEAALRAEKFDVSDKAVVVNDPSVLLNANLTWLDPNGDPGRWVTQAYTSMTNSRHGYLSRQRLRVHNIFAVDRPDRDQQFLASVRKVAQQRQGRFTLRANLQPKSRPDLGTVGDAYGQANVIFSIHGTRAVNVAPIMQSHFRLPRSLSGVVITGANFGHGVYLAVDRNKSWGYTGYGSSYYGSGGSIQGRHAFMFLCDMIMGDAYRAPSTGSWSSPPNGKDSVFGVGGDSGHRLENDEMVVFDPTYCQIRYLVEMNME